MSDTTAVTATAARRRPMRIALLAILLATAAVLGITTTPAHALTGDTYRARSFDCTSNQYRGRVVNVYPPAITAAYYQNVYWKAVLYKWDSYYQQWYAYKDSGWNNGAAQSNWSGGWVDSGGQTILFSQFSFLPAGYYEVRNYYQWQDGASANSWSPYLITSSGTTWYCGLS